MFCVYYFKRKNSQFLLNELHLGLYYLSNESKIVIFGSKSRNNNGSSFIIKFIEDQSKMVDGGGGDTIFL